MTPFIDVNIWIYLANPESSFHPKVSGFLDPYLQGTKNFVTSWQVFYEFVRTATDPKMHTTPATWSDAFHFMERIFGLAGITILQEGPAHSDSLQFALEKAGYRHGHFIHDCHIAALLHENGIKTIITADHDFRRFPFLEVIDPTLNG